MAGRRTFITTVLAVLFYCAPGQAADSSSEYQVKAVYLFNFGQFVEWPPQAYESPDAPFVIAVVGKDPFGDTLSEVVRGETIGGRPFVVKHYKEVGEITACNILFIARSETGRLEQWLQALRGRNVLTVTDIEGAERRGAVIALFTENNRVRMRINLSAARASSLVISSKLLRPAEVIGHEGEP